MELSAIKPEVERYIDELVNTGSFTSREAVVETAVIEMMRQSAEAELDEEDVKAIAETEDEIDRGETVDFRQFAAGMRRKFAKP